MEYHELVVEGPYLLVKGFVEGSANCLDDPEIFFSKEENIERETLNEKLKEWLGFAETLVHIVVDEKNLEKLTEFFKKRGEKFGLEIKSELKILSASFEFKMEAFTPKHGKKMKKLLAELPPTITIAGKEEEEKVHDVEERGIYTPDHPYELNIKGTIVGPFKEVVETHRKWKEFSLIILENIKLTLEET